MGIDLQCQPIPFCTRGMRTCALRCNFGASQTSAPLFGAAGSGYLNQGHPFEFTPRGSVSITGGAVGPEGSVYAHLAMLVALILLVVTGTDGSHLRGDGE